MFTARIKTFVSISSLLLLAAVASPVDWRAVHEAYRRADSPSAKRDVLRSLVDDPQVEASFGSVVKLILERDAKAPSLDSMEQMLELRSRASLPATDPKQAVDAIKRNPLYEDSGEKEDANWLGKAFDRLGDLLKPPEIRSPSGPPAGNQMPDLNWIARVIPVVIYTVLGALVLLLIVLIARHISWRNTLRRRSVAILEEDEPERTVDEWLAQADALAAQQRYREAVRCLYLACLLRFDEHGVARFIRGETNWEHLARITSSPAAPPGFDFLAPTRDFDRIWYGFRVRGQEDVDRFRDTYRQLTAALEARR